MKNTSLLAAALAVLGFTVLAKPLTTVRKITPGFSVRFATKLAEGTFEELTGTIAFDPADVAHSKINYPMFAYLPLIRLLRRKREE